MSAPHLQSCGPTSRSGLRESAARSAFLSLLFHRGRRRRELRVAVGGRSHCRNDQYLRREFERGVRIFIGACLSCRGWSPYLPIQQFSEGAKDESLSQGGVRSFCSLEAQ